MIDHSYSIIIREVSQTTLPRYRFAAKLSQLYVILDGKRIVTQYPNRECFGNSQLEAIASASHAIRSWLTWHYS